MTSIKQGTVRASKKENAKIKLQRQFKDERVKVILEPAGNNKWEYLILLNPPEIPKNRGKEKEKE